MAQSDTSRPSWGPSTLAVHGGEPATREGRSISAPVVLSSTYPFTDTAELVAFMEGSGDRVAEYGRYGNPTVGEAERKIAALERAEAAVLMASGMAAIATTLLVMVRSGQHVVMTADVYRKTRVFAREFLAKFGVGFDVVPPDVSAIARAMTPDTRIVFTESPTNPYLRVLDLARAAEVAHQGRAKLLVDSTFATPINCRPLEHGVDLVIHSATKYLGGHNDILGGVVLGSEALVSAIRERVGTLGPILDPHNAFLLLRGLKTLALRVERQNETALRLAQVLEQHRAVREVWYPGLVSHPDHALAKQYLRGFGGVVSFEMQGGLAAGTRLVDALCIPRLAASLGGVDSLVEQPPLMSYYELTPEQRAEIGIREGLVRYSVGIEDADDLEHDLLAALEQL